MPLVDFEGILMDMRYNIEVIAGTFAFYWALFFIFIAIMRTFPFYKKMERRHQVEWIMRMVATLNGSFGGIVGGLAVFGSMDKYLDIVKFTMPVSLGYFLYDTIGNIYYYPLLRKTYILFHHIFCFIAGSILIYGHVWHLGAMSLFALVPDPIDHILWFFHRLNMGRPVRKLVHHLNTAFFVVNRVLLGTYFNYMDTVALYEAQKPLWLTASVTLMCIVFLGMNIKVSIQRLKLRGPPVMPSPMSASRHAGATVKTRHAAKAD